MNPISRTEYYRQWDDLKFWVTSFEGWFNSWLLTIQDSAFQGPNIKLKEFATCNVALCDISIPYTTWDDSPSHMGVSGLISESSYSADQIPLKRKKDEDAEVMTVIMSPFN